MREHINWLQGIYRELAVRGKQFEEEKVFLLLSSLDTSFDMVVTSLETMGVEKLTGSL